MGILIYKDPRFDKSLQALKDRGGLAAEAAKKTEETIVRLASEGSTNPYEIRKYTRRGEHRIKGCRKFDLGSGYRLIFIRRDNRIVFCYAGEHDECFRWVERNRKLKYEIDELTEAVRIVPDTEDDFEMPDDVLEEQRFIDEYEKSLMMRIETPDCQKALAGWFK